MRKRECSSGAVVLSEREPQLSSELLVKEESFLVAVCETAEFTEIVLFGFNTFLANYWEAELIVLVWIRK